MLGNEDRMKISTKGRYAVRVMLDLALNNNCLLYTSDAADD